MTRTAIDDRKDAADFRTTYANGGSFTLEANPGAPVISGRGIKAYRRAGAYEVTMAALKKLHTKFHIEADF